VIPNDGTNGIEFFIGLTYPQFLQANKEKEWTEVEDYSQLAKVLKGTLKTACEETLDANFSDDANRIDDIRDTAIDKPIVHFLNCKKPCSI